jgi:hypothetical protein
MTGTPVCTSATVETASPLVHCFAGCTYDQVRNALRAKGIELPRRSSSPSPLSQKQDEADPTDELDRYHRLRYAYSILRSLVIHAGYERAKLLLPRYLKPRSIGRRRCYP